MKNSRKIASILILFLVIFITPFQLVRGFDVNLWSEAVKSEQWEATNPLAWVQAPDEEVAVPKSMNTITMEGVMAGKTLGSSGCTYFAHCAMLTRAGVWDTKSDGVITNFYKYCENKGMNKESDYNGMFYWQGIQKYFPDVEVITATVKQRPYAKVTELEQFAKDAYNRGDFVVAYLQTQASDPNSGHAIFIEGIKEDGTVRVFDNSSEGDVLGGKDTVFYDIMNEMGGREAPIVYAMFEYSVAGVDSRNTNPLTDRFAGSLDADKGVFKEGEHKETKDKNSKEEKEKSSLKEEFDSIGWQASELLLLQHDMDMTWYRDQLSQKEKTNIENLKENIKADSFDIEKFFKQATVMFGLMLCVYGLLLIVAQVLDMVNPFMNVSLVRTVTFGKFNIRPSYDHSKDNGDRRKHISVFKYYVYVAFIMGLGMMIATGRIQEMVFHIIDIIQNFIG